MNRMQTWVFMAMLMICIVSVKATQWDDRFVAVSSPPLAQPGCSGCTYINGTVVDVIYQVAPEEVVGAPVLGPILIFNGTNCPGQAAPFEFRIPAGSIPPNTLFGTFYGLNATFSLTLANETATNQTVLSIVDQDGCETILQTQLPNDEENEGDKVKKELIDLIDKYFVIAAIVCGVLCALSVTYPCLPCCVACLVACCSPCILLALMLTFLLAEDDAEDFVNDLGD